MLSSSTIDQREVQGEKLQKTNDIYSAFEASNHFKKRMSSAAEARAGSVSLRLESLADAHLASADEFKQILVELKAIK